MELLDSQKNWDQLGKDDPLWVVLSHAEKKGGKWDLSEFFATGKTEIATALQEVTVLGKSITYGRALDFGCGVGRLTQALATYFDEAHGIDISPSMIEHANGFNPFGPKCIFHVNSQDNLHLFESNYFDFIYSVIVLQHIKPKYSIKYIEEFMRILKPGGVCVFQFTTATFLRRLVPEFLVERYRRFKRKGKMGIFSIPERQVINVIQNAGGKILQVNRDKYGIFSSRWVNLRFVVIKSNGS
jgi:ubiquinone/menaquinone biosynthesis C-methylase UbiE